MKRKRHTAEEIIKKLRTISELIAGGKSVEEGCRGTAISVATYRELVIAPKEEQ